MHLRLYLWHGNIIWVGQGLAISPHLHVAHQLSIGLDREFAHETLDGQFLRGHGFVCPSGVPHGFHSESSERQVIFWSEPHTWEGTQVAKRFPSGRITVLDEATVDRVRDELHGFDFMSCDADEARRGRDAFFATMFGPKPPVRSLDPRVARATEYYFCNRSRDVTVSEVAQYVGLSESHFSRLFSKTAGVSPTRYRLWMRALEATRLAIEGSSITDAALGAGFADAAHYTRTYNKLIGGGGPRVNTKQADIVVCDERWLR